MSEMTTTNGKNNMGQKKSGKSNALTLAQVYRLGKALETEQAYLNERGFSFAEAAEYLTEKLGFRVTDHNVESAAHAAEVSWKKRTRSRSQDPRRMNQQRLSRHRTEMLHEVRMFLIHIATELQIPVPEKLKEPLLIQNDLYTVDEGKQHIHGKDREVLLEKTFGSLSSLRELRVAPGSVPAEGA